MTARETRSIEAISERCEQIIGTDPAVLQASAPSLADEILAMGEDILIAWHAARDNEPTMAQTEGFRLLALHRQAARGNPSFNACRETCREIVYHHNLVRLEPGAPEAGRRIKLGAMVVHHLALFVGGKLEADGLGEFCCSSRPLRQGEERADKTFETEPQLSDGGQ